MVCRSARARKWRICEEVNPAVRCNLDSNSCSRFTSHSAFGRAISPPGLSPRRTHKLMQSHHCASRLQPGSIPPRQYMTEPRLPETDWPDEYLLSAIEVPASCTEVAQRDSLRRISHRKVRGSMRTGNGTGDPGLPEGLRERTSQERSSEAPLKTPYLRNRLPLGGAEKLEDL